MDAPEPGKKPKLYGQLSFQCTLAQKRRVEIEAAKRSLTTAQFLRDWIETILEISEATKEVTKEEKS